MTFRGYTPVVHAWMTSPDISARASQTIASSRFAAARWILALLITLVPAISCLSAAQERPQNSASSLSPPGCSAGNCGLRSSSAYGELVIGIFQHVYSEDDMRKLYRWGKTSQVWRDFDDDMDDFLARNRVLLINVGKPQTPFVLIVSRAEYDGAPPLMGDLVRYVPLRSHHDAEGRKAPSRFSVLSGCIAILCRTPDGSCFKNYEQGFFNLKTGSEMDHLNDRLVPFGKVVDPISALPLRSAKNTR